MRAYLLLPWLSLSAACALEVPSDEPAELGGTTLAVQAYLDHDHYYVAHEASGVLHDATAATGTVFVPFHNADRTPQRASDGTELRGSCGVTFVSSRYAITAAHCLTAGDVWDPPSQPLVVQRYRVTGYINYSASSKLSGTFPHYTHPRLGPEHRYQVDRFSCRVVSRCGYGDYNCAVSEPDPERKRQVDIALLKCDTRPDPTVYGHVAVASAPLGPVKMFWSHELYDVVTQERYAGADATALDRYWHYTYLDDTADNFHYFGGERNQLLPLVSRDWFPGDIPLRRSHVARQGALYWTDLFGCHGSSGSGVMQFNHITGKYELLGPALLAMPSAWGGDGSRLCVSEDHHRPGEASLAYLGAEYTRQMAQVAYNDCFEGFTTCTFTPIPGPRPPFPKFPRF